MIKKTLIKGNSSAPAAPLFFFQTCNQKKSANANQIPYLAIAFSPMGVMETQAVCRGNNWTSSVSQVQCQRSGFGGSPHKAPTTFVEAWEGRRWRGGNKEVWMGDQMEAEDHWLPSLPRTFHGDLEWGLLPSLGEATVPVGGCTWWDEVKGCHASVLPCRWWLSHSLGQEFLPSFLSVAVLPFTQIPSNLLPKIRLVQK